MKDCLFENGMIFTSDDTNLYADAMLVSDGTIQWIGKREAIAEGDYERVNLKGACVVPGFIDAHMHPVMLADFSKKISALPPEVHSIEELKERIRQVRKTKKAGEWIEGWGYDEGKFEEKRSLNRYDLDESSAGAPVSITRTCGHIRCVNSRALELAGITRNTPDPVGGEIERDASGEPTGVLKETARDLVLPFIPKETYEEKVQNLVDLGNRLKSQGIVAVCDMGNLDTGDNFSLYQEAIRHGYQQETAIYYMWDYFADDPKFRIPKERRNKNGQVFVAGLKLIGDGSVSGRTAWMDKPYLDTDREYGISTCSDTLMESAVAFCKQYHCQLSMHAMGGQAITRAVERAYREENWMLDDTPYVRLEHLTDPPWESIRKAAEKGIFFVMQPIFLYAEIESYLKNLGETWMKQCSPVRTILDQGVKLCFSTDAPATSWAVPYDPFPCLKAAVTRKAYDGTDCGQDQKVDVETAVKLYTGESAKAAGFRRIGQLKKGYKAHFAILDRNLFTIPKEEIDQVKVEALYMNGECIYQR